MQAYRTEATITEGGKLALDGLPFRVGERVDVIVLPAGRDVSEGDACPLHGTLLHDERPADPVTPGEREALTEDGDASNGRPGRVLRRDEAVAILVAHREDLKRYRVKSLALFGSVARDEAGPDSDVDLLVEFERPAGLFNFVALQQYLEDLLGRRVDLGTPDSLRETLRSNVMKDIVHVP